MRAHHVIAVVVVLVIGFGVKQFLFAPKQADAGPVTSTSMDVLQMQRDIDMKGIPIQKIRDETFVFDNE